MNAKSERHTSNHQARARALQAVAAVAIEPTSLITYQSQGRLLIIGTPSQGLAIRAALENSGLRCYLLARGEGVARLDADLPAIYLGQNSELRIGGHLGDFTVSLVSAEHGEVNVAHLLETGTLAFDLILDLHTPPLLAWELLPLGYYAPRDDPAALERALTELPLMTGEFEKAAFFQYNASLCAHGGSGLTGCTRCLDVCPTGAISSLGDKINVDPHICQGAGSCATACPSGAISYSYPPPATTLERLRLLLGSYREAGGMAPILLFHDADSGQDLVEQQADTLPDTVFPIAIEEAGSVGLECWLAALAYGAARIVLVVTEQTPPSVHGELHAQLATAQALLAGLGYPAPALQLVDTAADLLPALTAGELMPAFPPAGFAASNRKRDTLYYALDHLAAHAAATLPATFELPAQAPFGEIRVEQSACTLCMACVAICPADALFDGVDQPRLEFLEANCVQCGLCETACPEDAISRRPRFVVDPRERRQRRLLHAEAAFHCIACGKPFATRSLIDKLQAKLEGHHMFQDEQARRRLLMCGDCRVGDLFRAGGEDRP